MSTKKRYENDSFGKIAVPKDFLWGAQTQRSINNFNIGTETFSNDFIKAFAIQKKACALANKDLKVLDNKIANLIIKATDQILKGDLDNQFPLKIWQTGSGTQTNMNLNEVISNYANKLSTGRLGTKNLFIPMIMLMHRNQVMIVFQLQCIFHPLLKYKRNLFPL